MPDDAREVVVSRPKFSEISVAREKTLEVRVILNRGSFFRG